MQVMVIMKGDPSTEQMSPPTEVFAMMGAFNRKLAEAGVLVDANGLQPSAIGKRVTLDADGPVVVDGPFAETKELLSGYWTLEVGSFDEAIEWMRQSPLNGHGMEVELRKVGEFADFGANFTDELVEQHLATRELVVRNAERALQASLERRAGSPHDAAERIGT